MKWQTVATILASILVVSGVVTYTDLFGSLFQLTGVSSTHSGDIFCKEDCASYINVTTTYWRICFDHYEGTQYEDEFLFKKRTRSRTLHVNLNKVDNLISTEPRVEVDWLVPARGKGNWRLLQDGDCWDRGKINKIKLVGHKQEWQDVKWSFEVDKYVEIDPLWSSGVEISNKIVKELCTPIYKTWTDEIPHYKNCTVKDMYLPNGTNEPGYDYSCLDYIEKIEYKDVQVDCEKVGKVNVSGKIVSELRKWCQVEKDEICCLSDIDGGVYGAWYRTDGSVDKTCKKVNEISIGVSI